jgi:hypothetical protein
MTIRVFLRTQDKKRQDANPPAPPTDAAQRPSPPRAGGEAAAPTSEPISATVTEAPKVDEPVHSQDGEAVQPGGSPIDTPAGGAADSTEVRAIFEMCRLVSLTRKSGTPQTERRKQDTNPRGTVY